MTVWQWLCVKVNVVWDSVQFLARKSTATERRKHVGVPVGTLSTETRAMIRFCIVRDAIFFRHDFRTDERREQFCACKATRTRSGGNIRLVDFHKLRWSRWHRLFDAKIDTFFSVFALRPRKSQCYPEVVTGIRHWVQNLRIRFI